MDVTAKGVFIGSIAHTLIGVSLIWDKVLLGRRERRSVVSYVFWLRIVSTAGLGLAAFGFTMPSCRIVLAGLVAGNQMGHPPDPSELFAMAEAYRLR